MICAGESLSEGGAMEVEVAIVGAGPIGLAVAIRLAGRVGRVAVIEAGGTQFKPAQSLKFFKAAQISDPRHLPTELNRRRMLEEQLRYGVDAAFLSIRKISRRRVGDPDGLSHSRK